MDVEIIKLYEASLSGEVNTLTNLIQDNPLILEEVKQRSFYQTPLHIAASRGHLEFTRALLSQSRPLASIPDSRGRCPLHLASEKDHVEIVQELLDADKAVCMRKDKDGWIPLHIAVMQGHIKVILKLIAAQPESTGVRLQDKEETVFHLCVKYKHLEALKLLVDLAPHGHELVKSKDIEGNTVLHIGVVSKQMEILKYLLSIPEVIEIANDRNEYGMTASRFGLIRLKETDTEVEDILLKTIVQRTPFRARVLQFLLKFYLLDDAESWWSKEARGHLLTAATLIATVAFQAGIAPPGGVWQEDNQNIGSRNSYEAPSASPGVNYHEPGTSILASVSGLHTYFVLANTFSIVASIIVILILISGISLKVGFVRVVLNLAMSGSITFMALTYGLSIYMMSPGKEIFRPFFLFLYWIFVFGVPIIGTILPYIYALKVTYLPAGKLQKFYLCKFLRWFSCKPDPAFPANELESGPSMSQESGSAIRNLHDSSSGS